MMYDLAWLLVAGLTCPTVNSKALTDIGFSCDPPGLGFVELFLVHIVPPTLPLQLILCQRIT